MMSAARRYSLANPPPTEGDLDGRETVQEAQILEMQALKAERDGDGGRSIVLMERALQIRCQVVNQLRERWAVLPESTVTVSCFDTSAVSATSHRLSTASLAPMNRDDILREYQTECSDLYDAAERLVVCCNARAVEHFKKDAFDEAGPLLQYAVQLTEEDAYPLSEVEERRRHLRGVTLNNLGCMERRRGHFSEALEYMKASMTMTETESPVAYMNISAILIQLRLTQEGMRMAERSIELLAQTPEDPSLLAVAHHNLAMALEPQDTQRCLEEYALAHQIACATLGPESPTTQSIEHSWQRYKATRSPVPPSSLRSSKPQYGTIGNGSGISDPRKRSLMNSAGVLAAPGRSRLVSMQPESYRVATTLEAPRPVDAAEIFPHPFLLTASAPRTIGSLPSRPAVAPRRLLPSGAPVTPGEAFASTASTNRSQTTSSRQIRSPRGAETLKTLHRPFPSPCASPVTARSVVAAPHAAPLNGSRGAAHQRADGRAAHSSSMVPSPPPSSSQRGRPTPLPTSTTSSASVSGRYPLARRHETRNSPPSTRQRRLSEEDDGTKKSKLDPRLSPLREKKSTSGRVPRPPVGGTPRATNGGVNVFHPPQRHLTPLSAVSSGTSAANRGSPRPSRDTTHRASHTNPPDAAAVATASSLDSEPLDYLQNRLDVLLQDEVEQERRYAHATVIQRHYRGHLGRRRAAVLRSERARVAKLADLRRQMAARQIQRSYRRYCRQKRYPLAAGRATRYVAGRRSAQHRAATDIQRIARGWLARRRYAERQQLAREAPAAASRIQRWVRSIQAKRQYAKLRAEKAAHEKAMLAREQQDYAAARIQRQWRAYKGRKAGAVDLENRRMARAAREADQRVQATVRIQAAWRRRRAMKLYRSTYARTAELRSARHEYEQRRQAAVTLQSFGRMIIARQQSLPLLTSARLRAAAEINKRGREGCAATTIQCAYRSHAARRVCAEKRAARAAQQRRDTTAVQTMAIQRAGRGYMARKHVGSQLSAWEREAERYERKLRKLQEEDETAAIDAQEGAQVMQSKLQTAETHERTAVMAAEQDARNCLRHHYGIAMDNVNTDEAERQAALNAVMPTLTNFARIIKAKQSRTQRQEARDAYLQQCNEAEQAAREETSALTVTAFMRHAGPRRTLLSRMSAVQSYNEERVAQEAQSDEEAEAGEEPFSEGKTDARASSAASNARGTLSPKWQRPTTAEEVAAERAALDNLQAVERELQSQEVARSKYDEEAAASKKRTSTSALEAELMAQQKAIWQAEQEADKKRRQQRDALLTARFHYQQERIAAADAEKDLTAYRMGRVRLSKPRATDAQEAEVRPGHVHAHEETSSKSVYHKERFAQERAAVQCIEAHCKGLQARRHVHNIQRIRDEYLAVKQDVERHEGPVLVNDRLREAAKQSSTMASSNKPMQRKKKTEKYVPAMAQERPPVVLLTSSFPNPVSPTPTLLSPGTLDGFARIIKAKQSRTQRQEARDAYLQQCNEAEQAAREETSALTVTAFMRHAGPRRTLLSRMSAVQSYNEERVAQEAQSDEEAETGEEPFSEGKTDARASSAASNARGTLSPKWQRPTTAEEVAAERAALDNLQAVERELQSQGAAANTSQLTPEEARARLKGFAKLIHDKKELRRRQISRDACMSQKDDYVAAGQPQESLALSPTAPEETNSMDGYSTTSDALTTELNSAVIRNIYRTERRSYAATLFAGFARIIKAKQSRTQRQEARDAYLQQCNEAEQAAREETSALTVTAFMRHAGPRRTLLSRMSAVQSYNEERVAQEAQSDEEAEAGEEPFSEGKTDARASSAASNARGTLSPKWQRPTTAEEVAAERAALDNLQAVERELQSQDADAQRQAHYEDSEKTTAVEEVLYTSALAIQRVYRGHLGRQQAAMAMVQRDLYLLYLQEECEAEEGQREEEEEGGQYVGAEAEESEGEPADGAAASTAPRVPLMPSAYGPLHTGGTVPSSSHSEVSSTAIVTEVDPDEL